MKRLAIITVGKTHSGKSTFARLLEKNLANSFIVDQDHHAAFIHSHYQKLQPTTGPNTLKHSITKLIVDYAKKHTDLHFIVSNSNRTKRGREYLLHEIYPKDEFIRILVYFDISNNILRDRVANSTRSTNIFRVSTSFEEVLLRQQAEAHLADYMAPTEDEAEYLYKITDNKDVESVIAEIVRLSKAL